MQKDLTLNIHMGFSSEFNQLLYNFLGRRGSMNFFSFTFHSHLKKLNYAWEWYSDSEIKYHEMHLWCGYDKYMTGAFKTKIILCK